ncbi:MFS transporter [Oceanobacillus chungangensis]|uniref:MFS transporter n=1 Tax=Oceanobacillus chungangensis TaxID=1229152 RepID=A0A3D8PXT7_9BACI|nr:MFS transporter [Oceanobacillus chungangensis]RDW19705.1 MFS transporter [Oceanobacillus chungangensis]
MTRTIQTSQVLANSKFNKFHLLVFLWCFYVIAFDGFDVALYGIGLPLMMEDYNITVVEAGAISSYSVIGTMTGTFLFGSLSDIIGRKKAIAICLILFSVFTFLSGFASNADIFLIMRIVAALGLGGVMPILVAVMAEYSPKKKRALTVAIMYCGYSIGAILASLIGMYLMESLGWRFLYWISIIPFLTLPFFLRQFPESVSYHLQRKQGDNIASILNKVDPDGNYQATDNFEYERFKESTKKFPIKKVFSDNKLLSTLAFWLAVGCSMLVITGLTTWLPKIMLESGHGIASSLSFNLVLSVGQITGSIFGGILVGRVGHRRVLISMFFIGSLSFVFLSLTSNTLLLYLLIALTGACTVGTQNLVNPYISEYYPREIRATGLSIAVGVGRIGGILAPVAIALLLTTNLAPQHAFMAFAVPSLLGAIAFMIVQEKYASFDRVIEINKQKTA